MDTAASSQDNPDAHDSLLSCSLDPPVIRKCNAVNVGPLFYKQCPCLIYQLLCDQFMTSLSASSAELGLTGDIATSPPSTLTVENVSAESSYFDQAFQCDHCLFSCHVLTNSYTKLVYRTKLVGL